MMTTDVLTLAWIAAWSDANLAEHIAEFQASLEALTRLRMQKARKLEARKLALMQAEQVRREASRLEVQP